MCARAHACVYVCVCICVCVCEIGVASFSPRANFASNKFLERYVMSFDFQQFLASNFQQTFNFQQCVGAVRHLIYNKFCHVLYQTCDFQQTFGSVRLDFI